MAWDGGRSQAELRAVETSVDAVLAGEEFGFRAALDDASGVHHEDHVGVADSAQAVRDGEDGAVRHHAVQGLLHDGEVKGINVTDELLKNVAAIRTDGNIQPQPSMTVEKVPMEEGDIIMVKVEPSIFPPVRYKGRIWIRVGPRKGVANEEDEHILMEKRRANVTSFDSAPCLNATIDDLDLQKFNHYYLPKAMTDEEIKEDNRDVKLQLSSFGFFDTHYDCPTNAGMLFFAKNLRRFIPGAYVQYVRFAGKDRAGDIMTEHVS